MVKLGIFQPRFDAEYPLLTKDFCDALRERARKRTDSRFLLDNDSGLCGWRRYTIHPLRAAIAVRFMFRVRKSA